MIALRHILSLIWTEQRRAMRRGLALSVLVTLFGIGLLALSGWFIVAAGIAGLAGLGATFDVFRPSAGVRFLAMARTAGRYGERLLTHDATLKALTSLRVRLLDGLSVAEFGLLSRLRGGQALNRLTLDVDALDGLAIRLVFPALAGVISALVGLIALWWLVAPPIALWVVGTPVLGGLAVLGLSAVAALPPAVRAETRQQDLRAGVIEHLRGRAVLAVSGRLPSARAALLDLDRDARSAAMAQSRIEWRAAAILQAVTAMALSGTLLICARHVASGRIGAAQAALALFATLSLAELSAGLLRGAVELGRMRDAARRVVPLLAAPAPPPAPPARPGAGVQATSLSVAAQPGLAPLIADLDLDVRPGETVAITGASGRGKTALLNTLAGLVPPSAGLVRIGGRLGYLTQRPALIAGSVRDTLALAAPQAGDATMRQVLDLCALDVALDRPLGEGGSGLSGGQARRLAMARVLIRRPDVLLLDEPTEGLDRAAASRMMAGMRRWLPDAAVLIAAHRDLDLAAADRTLRL